MKIFVFEVLLLIEESQFLCNFSVYDFVEKCLCLLNWILAVAAKFL